MSYFILYYLAEYYLLLKGHEAHSGNWTARLYSPHISINSPRNLTFWYHMNGAGIGNLRLYKENADGSNEVLFVKKGRQGVSWEQASVNLPVGFYKVKIHWWFSQCSFWKARMQRIFFFIITIFFHRTYKFKSFIKYHHRKKISNGRYYFSEHCIQ